MASFAAQSFLQHDIGHGMGYSFSSFACKEDFLCLVRICVARQAICNGIDVFCDLVLNIQVALVAFDLVRIDMGGMHEVRFIEFIQPVSLPVTFVAVFPGHLPISDDGVGVAFVTRETAVKDDRVVIF